LVYPVYLRTVHNDLCLRVAFLKYVCDAIAAAAKQGRAGLIDCLETLIDIICVAYPTRHLWLLFQNGLSKALYCVLWNRFFLQSFPDCNIVNPRKLSKNKVGKSLVAVEGVVYDNGIGAPLYTDAESR
jgi:hypothetical protein